MAISLHPAQWGRRQSAPLSLLSVPQERRAPLWPTFSIVFLLCLSLLLPPISVTVLNAILVALASVVVLATNKRIDKRLLVVVALVSVTALLGFVTGRDAERYEYFKDAWYVFNPVLVLLVGYVLYCMKPDLGRGLRAFVVAGLLVACWQLRGYVIEPSLIYLPAPRIREIIGTGSFVPVVALVILLMFAGKWRSVIRLPPWFLAIVVMLTAMAVAGVFSRSSLVVIGIGFAAFVGCFSRHEWWRVGLPVVVLVALGYMVQLYVDTESSFALHTYFGKLTRTLRELTDGDGASIRDINLNFRAYETDRALSQFAQGSVQSMLFGQGFGATVDLGITMPLQHSDTGYLGVRRIGSFHNGYIFLLTKVGLLGLFLYGAVLVYLYRFGRQYAARPSSDPKSADGRLFQFTVVTLAATTFFIGGLFNRSDMMPVLLLCGFLLGHLGRETRPPLSL